MWLKQELFKYTKKLKVTHISGVDCVGLCITILHIGIKVKCAFDNNW